MSGSKQPRRSSKAAEYLRLKAGTGTHIYLEHAVKRSLIIDDLVAGVWLRSDRERLQIFGQIVLPKTRDPSTGEAVRVRLPALYETPGGWQQLNIANTPALLQRQLPILRAKLKHPVDIRGAYLEALVLNAFGGPGTTRIWFDDIELRGSVDVQTDLPRLKLREPRSAATGVGPQLRVSKLTVDGRPFFPRIVDHQGESFELLKQLGFNAIFLPELPTEQQQNEARQLKLWLICPPPPELDSTTEYPSVIAWHLGDDISAAVGIRSKVDELRRNDPRSRLILAAPPSTSGPPAARWMFCCAADFHLVRVFHSPNLTSGCTKRLDSSAPERRSGVRFKQSYPRSY